MIVNRKLELFRDFLMVDDENGIKSGLSTFYLILHFSERISRIRLFNMFYLNLRTGLFSNGVFKYKQKKNSVNLGKGLFKFRNTCKNICYNDYF